MQKSGSYQSVRHHLINQSRLLHWCILMQELFLKKLEEGACTLFYSPADKLIENEQIAIRFCIPVYARPDFFRNRGKIVTQLLLYINELHFIALIFFYILLNIRSKFKVFTCKLIYITLWWIRNNGYIISKILVTYLLTARDTFDV